jgi:hypothetical protein
MKLNKSYLGLVVVFLFILSSCSQSRYGNLTRRTKANHIAKKVDKPTKTKEAKVVELKEVIPQETTTTENEEVVVAETTSFTKERIAEKVGELLPVNNKRNKAKTVEVDSELAETLVPLAERLETQIPERIVKKAKKLQPDSDTGLIKMILIIILLLILASLLWALIPGPLRYILSLVILILIILWLIRML